MAEIYPELDNSYKPEVYVQGTVHAKCADFKSFDEMFDAVTSDVIDLSARKGVTANDRMCYIYTSGTTGLLSNILFTVNY